MAKRNVEIMEILSRVVEVEVPDELDEDEAKDRAKEIARAMWCNGEEVLDGSDFVDVEFHNEEEYVVS